MFQAPVEGFDTDDPRPLAMPPRSPSSPGSPARRPARSTAVRPGIWALLAALPFLACRAPGLAGEPPVPSPLPFATLPADGPVPPQEHAWVIVGADTVVAEIASTPEARERGLMFREEIPDGTGMLFVFGDEAVRGFWMDNTYVDLDIAFLDASYRIVDIQQLEAMSTEVRDSRAPFLYALEVRRGWFEERGVAVGDVVRIEMKQPGGAQTARPTEVSTRERAPTSSSSL